ncbi:MAG: hypothetical protein ACLR23_11950 [Clostridia bacterium]
MNLVEAPNEAGETTLVKFIENAVWVLQADKAPAIYRGSRTFTSRGIKAPTAGS